MPGPGLDSSHVQVYLILQQAYEMVPIMMPLSQVRKQASRGRVSCQKPHSCLETGAELEYSVHVFTPLIRGHGVPSLPQFLDIQVPSSALSILPSVNHPEIPFLLNITSSVLHFLARSPPISFPNTSKHQKGQTVWMSVDCGARFARSEAWVHPLASCVA